MNKSKFRKSKLSTMICAAIASAGAGVVSPTLLAQSDNITLEEIVVTAQRREQNLQLVPIAVTAFSAAEMEEKGITTLADIEKSVPNTQMRESRGTNSTLTAFIRGIGQQDPLWGFEPGIGIYVDDVYIARPQAAVLDVYDVERIEVLRGPQGTLYGKNTIGGAVKYVTSQLTGETKGKIKLSTGAYGQQDITVSGQVALIEDRLFLGGAIANLQRDGYGTQFKDYDPVSGNFGRTEENYNKDVVSGRISLRYLATDSLSFNFAADKTTDESNNRCGSRFATNTVAAPNGEFFDALPDVYDSQCGMSEKSSVETEGFSFTANYDVSDALSLKYVFASREGATDTRIDFDGTPLDSFEVPAVYRDEQDSHELQFNYSADTYNLVGGVYYYEGNAAGGFDALFGQYSSGVLTDSQFNNGVFGDVDTESTSFYLNGDLALNDRTTLTAGVRYTNDEKAASVNRQHIITSSSVVGSTTEGSGITFGNSANDTVLAVRTAYSKSLTNDDWSEISPSVKLSYNLSDDIMLYGGWSSGFKSGGFDMRADDAVNPIAQQGYDPETVDTYEIGFKSQLLDDRLRLNVTAFKSDFEDMQVTVQAPAPGLAVFSSTVVNAGESEIDGVELEATAQVTEKLSAQFVLGYMNAEFINVQDARLGNVAKAYDDGTGNIVAPWEMQNSPDWNGQFSLSYRTDLGEYGSLVLNTAISYRDETRMFDAVASILDQGSYTLWDAGAVWYLPGDTWTAGLQLKNINDETYRTGGYNFPATAFEDAILGFYGAPRTWMLSLTADF
ncbi:MAG: TonB-dependent receptor [SAR86 cluster bacterium]|uniref:TonB-dependent receptor n=1 Tax=SAR86 cluster bacterium TaxID=2030880 RepID=A0A2A4MPF9_9GAMM|nr:MAG: TonB-dependent receptor [SAR86 cluster bacterium]